MIVAIEDNSPIEIDLGAEKVLAAQKGEKYIAVEIKSNRTDKYENYFALSRLTSAYRFSMKIYTLDLAVFLTKKTASKEFEAVLVFIDKLIFNHLF